MALLCDVRFMILSIFILLSQAKERDRDVKRTSHNFISVTLSNSACNHCSKLLNYKPSVQCSSKLITKLVISVL